MNVSRSLTFLWTPWSIGLSILMVLVASGFAFVAWRRSGYRPAMGFLELLRVGIVALAAVMLNQPEWIEEFRPEEKPAIAVLFDASSSMDTRDVLRNDQGGSSALTRAEALRPFTDPGSWKKLQERMNVVIQPISAPQPGRGTDLFDPLASAPEKIRNLRGVVLASDGDWNDGQPPVQAAAQLRLKGVPVFTVPVGSPTRLPDIELLSLDAPTFGVAGKAVRIPFTIESSLPREYTTTVTLRTSDGDEVSKEIRIAPMGRTSDWVVWKPKATGDFTLSLNVPKHADEALVDNNQINAPIAIREEKLRVLVIESTPRWEYRYLRNALSRDPGIEVSCLLFHPGLSKGGGGNKDYIKQFPAGLDELSKYDVVFLGDVGLDDGQLTAEQCRLIKGLVEHQASGLVFMPGLQGRESSLMETELGDLCPVMFDTSQPGGWGSRTPNHFELTELGRKSLLTKLADTQDDNAEVWEGLPGFQWYAPVLRAKAGSDILCVHESATNEYGRLPLLVTRTFGAGKVLFMGTDGAWRWRKGVEDKYHYRFWGQVVRWMAYQRNMAKGETMRLYYVPDQPKMNQTLTFHANVMDRGGEPLHGGDVSARIKAPSGNTETIRLQSGGDEWGVFSGQYDATEPGKHQVTLVCKQTNATLEANFFVQGAAAERVGKPARPEVLEELARVSKGKVVELSKLDEIVRLLAELPDPPPSVRRVQLWSHPAFAAGLVVLLGVFWVGRKVIGLI
ncbi:hypothetical protein [Singulisphaera sp. PoT]|uniref:hypothetical protein n=1 Tax=Singulisphaera sp. PoT TaxID=3411797 RepID=UPI003BF5D422